MTSDAAGPVAERYQKQVTRRDPFLRRARDCSSYTLPFLLPPEGHSGSQELPTPYQSVGGRGVSTLAAKLLLALLPPGESFFRFSMDKEVETQMTGGQKDFISEVKKALGDRESRIGLAIENSNIRAALFETLKLLIVSGNVLLNIRPEGGIQFYKLTDYVTKRDPGGRVIEIITHQKAHPSTLKPAVREACHCTADEEPVDLYTSIKLSEDGKRYDIKQEIKGNDVPDSDGSYPVAKTPWLALRWQHIDGEDYGQGLCEELLGDLVSLEGLTKAMVVAAAAAAKVVGMVRPGSVTKAKDLTESESGDFITGEARDVSFLQLEKYADFRVALEMSQRIEERLAAAFLLREAVQRDAERVTAEEIRYMAAELDDALGGVFSILAQELQLPLVKRLILNLEKAGKLQPLPDGTVEPVIVTGLDALGRTNDLAKLDRLVQQLFGLSPELADKYVNIQEYVQRRAVALGVDSDGLIKTDDQVKQREEQDRQAAMQAQMAQQAAQTGGKLLEGAQKNG